MRARGSVGVAGVGALHPVRKRKIAGIKNVLAGLVIFAILYFLGNNYDSLPGTCHPLAVEPSVPSPHGLIMGFSPRASRNGIDPPRKLL